MVMVSKDKVDEKRLASRKGCEPFCSFGTEIFKIFIGSRN